MNLKMKCLTIILTLFAFANLANAFDIIPTEGTHAIISREATVNGVKGRKIQLCNYEVSTNFYKDCIDMGHRSFYSATQLQWVTDRLTFKEDKYQVNIQTIGGGIGTMVLGGIIAICLETNPVGWLITGAVVGAEVGRTEELNNEKSAITPEAEDIKQGALNGSNVKLTPEEFAVAAEAINTLLSEAPSN